MKKYFKYDKTIMYLLADNRRDVLLSQPSAGTRLDTLLITTRLDVLESSNVDSIAQHHYSYKRSDRIFVDTFIVL